MKNDQKQFLKNWKKDWHEYEIIEIEKLITAVREDQKEIDAEIVQNTKYDDATNIMYRKGWCGAQRKIAEKILNSINQQTNE